MAGSGSNLVLLFEWWCTACATVLSQGVGSLEIRHLERVDVHELPDSGVVWTKEVQALRGEKELRSSSFYDKSSILERMDTPETKQLVTSLSAATTSGGTTTICMWKRSSTNQPKSGRAYCRVLWVRKGHTANQASGESSQQSGRGYSSAGICEENVRTITHRVEDTAESSITVEQKIGKCEECSAERTMESGGSESCGYSGPDCQRTGGPRSSENSSRTLKARTRSSQSSYRSRRRTPTRPLLGHHRQHHFRITQSWSACRAPGAGTTGSPHTHQWSARVMRGCGSGDGCRRARRPDDGLRWLRRGIPADVIESIARRRNCHVGKRTIDLQTLTNRERNLNSHKPWRSPARTTHNAVRVTHTERLVLATSTSNPITKRTITQSQVRSRHKQHYRPSRQRHELAQMPRGRSARIVHQR